MTSPDRRPLVAGNWKMNTTVPEALELAAAVRRGLHEDCLAEVILLPPFISLWPVQQLLLEEPQIDVGAQDCYWEPAGAFTGEVSAEMLKSACRYVLVGHSERRHVFGETDQMVRRKLEAVLAAGLLPILAVGETLEERESGQAAAVVTGQTRAGLEGLGAAEVLRCTIAYEPVWAIGTGRSATAEDAASAAREIRQVVASVAPGTGEKVRVLYGGSVKASSAAELFGPPEVDGGLVGGASLDPVEFCAVIAAAGSRAN
jgi:triosephosphate isomerase